MKNRMRKRYTEHFVRLLVGCLASVFFVLAGVALGNAGKSGTEDAFSIVVLPDTQMYAWLHPEILHAQTTWIARNIE